MYTQEQINRDRKEYLKEMKGNAFNLLRDTSGTQICWEVSCDYDFNKGVIKILRSESECKKMIKDWANGEETKDVELFYRPIVIDSDSGETVTFQNLHYYKKDSYFVKSLNEMMNS